MAYKKRRSTPARIALKILCTFLGLILVVMAAATFCVQYLLGQVNFIDPEQIKMLTQSELDELLSNDDSQTPGGSEADAGDVSFDGEVGQIGGKGSGIVNILLIGQDRREGEKRARSDSMILCTFNKNTRQLIMTSFLRDLYVEIPGYQNNRINSAYAAGGMALLDDTLKENFGLHIDGNAEVDFNQFSQIVDLLGGVEIELRQDEADLINDETGSALSAGTQKLNGDQALCYARIRKLDADGDFSRTSRQRKVISALLDAYSSASLPTALSLMNKVLPMITTDMSTLQLLGYAVELFPMLSEAQFVSQRVPADGMYSNTSIDGMSVLVADMEATREMLASTLLGTG